ncbi:MAG: patatin-like phospholipase family protein [bacterium]|nr:patatin-like phospholipase family protein [bacterium]
MARPLKIGIALGSGGARGLAHAGVLQVLEEAGIKADIVAGTSMGSIVGALYAQNQDPAWIWDKLKTYISNPDFADYWAPFVPRDESEAQSPQHRLSGIFDFMQRKMIAVKTVTRPWIQEREKLLNPLGKAFGPISFEDLPIPLAAVALDLVSGRSVVYTKGPLVEGIYASCAIPAVFPPVYRDGMIICDGGGPFRVPVEACRDLGADVVIAVDIPAFEETTFSTGLDMILRSNTIARQRLNRFVCGTADFVIRPHVTEFHWADFGSGEACRARGYAQAEAQLGDLRRLLRWRRNPRYHWKMKARKLLKLSLD